MASPSVQFHQSPSIMDQFDNLGSTHEGKSDSNRPTRIAVGVGFLPDQLPPSPAAAFFAFGSNDYGCKEETFFDSQPWLDSDCEDDFFSVNGDYTPSQGNTPLHRSFKPVVVKTTCQPYIDNKSLIIGDKTSVSVSDNFPKKRLAELLQETRAEEEAERRKLTESMLLEKPGMKMGMHTIINRSARGIFVPTQRPKSGRCLPSIELYRNFSGRKKKVMSHLHELWM
ncbi:hypothetical protein SAY86_004421 [Trapa natans]|uniref:Uncharacterized protein n=1 Tax=Trapa natans TaxID=22666 RepID=A0AAN7RFL2_TRANT|nr:hypothetical protein SAY86_004421 [Trapa natans]